MVGISFPYTEIEGIKSKYVFINQRLDIYFDERKTVLKVAPDIRQNLTL